MKISAWKRVRNRPIGPLDRDYVIVNESDEPITVVSEDGKPLFGLRPGGFASYNHISKAWAYG